jgi:hypothetical protein
MRDAIAVAMAMAMLLVAASAGAQPDTAPNVSFNSFGTLGVVRSSEDEADFVADSYRPEGAGQSSEWSAKVDSRLGLQLTAEFDSRWSGVVQTVVEQRYDDSFSPIIEWANLKFQATPDFFVRAGRIVQPGAMVSEYRKVGYALPWVRPPQEVYRLQSITSSDGVDAGYSFAAGEFRSEIQSNVGRRNLRSANGVKTEVRDLWGLTGTSERGPLSLFLSYQRARVTVLGMEALFDAFRQFGPEGEAIAGRFDIHDKTVELLALGATYDPGDWFVMSEFAQLRNRTFVGDSRAGYVTGGYRLGAWTPYLTLARMQVESPTSHPGLTLEGLPPPDAEVAAGLNAALNQLLARAPAQRSVAIGTRWDFAHNLALKAQFDYLDLKSGSPGVLRNVQPGFHPGGSVSLFSLTLDFVF